MTTAEATEYASIVDDGVQLTIAICTYRRFDDLKACLKNIARQTLQNSRFRVLVIDNSLQPDESEKVRASLDLDFEFEYVITPKNGIAYARNQAIKLCRTPYLGYVDDDVTIAANWAEVMLDTFDRYDGRASCVSGKIKPKYETGTPPTWLRDELLWPLAVIDWGDQEKLLVGYSEWFVTASIGFDIHAVRLSGGFSENLGRKGRILLAHEDLQIVTDLRRMGLGIVYNPDFYAEHSIPEEKTTQKWFCKDAFWQTVSRMVYTSEKPFDLDGPIISQLTKSANSEVNVWRDQPDKKSVKAKLEIVAENASKIMARHGYDPNKYFPDPSFRTFFIVTPSFNAADTIEETMRSLFMQDGDVFVRYHVQDGGSTDGTIEILKEWERRLRENNLRFSINCRGVYMTWSSEPDSGAFDAVNRAFSRLPMDTTDLMGWLDADDILANGALKTLSSLFDVREAHWAIGKTSVITENEKAADTPMYVYPATIIRNGLCDGHHWKHIQRVGSFWRRGLWDTVGGLNENMKLAGDWDLWRRFGAHAEPVHLDRITGQSRMRTGQSSSENTAYEEEIKAVCSMKNREAIAASLAKDSMSTRFQQFHVSRGERLVENLSSKHIPPEGIQNFGEFSQPFFDNQFGDTSEKSTTDPHICAPDETRKKSPHRGFTGRKNSDASVHLNSTNNNAINRFVRKLRQYRIRRLIEKSSLFFYDYYLEIYPDVAKTRQDPLDHFLDVGWKEGRSPNPLFSETFYRATYPDIAQNSEISGLAHYIQTGWREKRDPHPDFSTRFYLSSNPDVRKSNINPLTHYLLHGIPEGRSPKWTCNAATES